MRCIAAFFFGIFPGGSSAARPCSPDVSGCSLSANFSTAMAGGGAHPRRVWRTGRKPITGSLALERLAAAQAARRGGTGGAGRSRPWGGDRRARVSAPAHHSRHMPKETICRRNRETGGQRAGPCGKSSQFPTSAVRSARARAPPGQRARDGRRGALRRCPAARCEKFLPPASIGRRGAV